MKRSEAMQYMQDAPYGLKKSTADKKINEAVHNPGQLIQVHSHLAVKAVQVDRPDRKWDFVFIDRRS